MEKQEAKIVTDPSTETSVKAETNKTPETAVADAPVAETAGKGRGPRTGGRNERRNPRRPRRGGGRSERSRPEFDQKIISIRRVTRVIAGGRRFSFSVAMVIGDKKGKVGVGIGKAGDTQLAIEKAIRDAKKGMLTVKMNEGSQIAHDVHKKYSSSEVMIMPAPGRGLVAGSSVRTVLELAGVKDVTAKLLSRSKNKLNNARATIEALKLLKS